MKVAVIYPEVYDLARFREKRKEFPPFGVLYLSSVMEQNGVNVEMFKINPENISLDLREFDAVAYSIPSSATYGLVKRSRFSSQFLNNALIMVGGVHPNFYPEKTLLDLKPDVVGVGEGEETIIELLQEAKTKNFQHIKGICYMRDGMPVQTQPREIIRDIDQLPLPARHLLNTDDFIMNDRLSNTDMRMAHVMFSRGCPFPCRFCAASQTKIQYRSGTSARSELLLLKEMYGIEGFAIVDDNFIVNKRKVHEISASVKDLGLMWSALSRVDTVDENLLEAMHSAGCLEMKYGMESASPRILAAMRKNITPDQIRYAVKTSVKIGIKVKLFLIHGYPGENEETTRETIKLLHELSKYIERVSLFRFVPLPGTYVFEHPEEFMLRNVSESEEDWDKYHIHHNDRHWWGTDADFESVNKSYEEIHSFVTDLWPSKHGG
jgi:anaerobic magnesium-protoporphyrin IX monomethyl ester cyclase